MRHFLILACAPLLAACGRTPVQEQQAYVFGTRVEVLVVSDDPAQGRQAIAAVLREFDRMHRAYHAWQPSELSDLNLAIAEGRPQQVSPELAAFIREAQEFSRQGNDLFDPGIGQLIRLWGFQADERFKAELPEEAKIKAWLASKPNFKPPLMLIALGPHHTNKGIEVNKAFSINIPDVSLIEKTDYCGLVSGAKTDKSYLFEVFYGELANAPLIKECPVSMSCTLYEAIKLPFDVLYIGEPKEVFTEEKYMTDNQLDIKKIKPFTLTMPDNHYWSVGENLGKAWGIGKTLKKK